MPHDFQLIETLLYEAGLGYTLLQRHTDRLRASAAHFGFRCDEPAVMRALMAAVEDRTEERLRMRLLLAASGVITITGTALAKTAPGATMTFVLSQTRVDSADPLLRHKTTRRALYDGEWQHFAETLGTDDVIYANERGEITEGSRTNIFVMRGQRLLTPALSCGLLPGVLRADLIARGTAQEAVLMIVDLERAEAVLLGNSVRGLVPALDRISTRSG